MKHLSVAFFASLTLVEALSSMERPQSTSDQEKIVTFEIPNQSSQEILKKYVCCSKTLKDMLDETGDNNLPVPAPIAKSFDLIKPYFQLAYSANNGSKETLKTLQQKFANHSDKELAAMINAFHYLDIPLLQNEATKHLLQPDRIDQCLKKGSDQLSANKDITLPMAQAMLKEFPKIREGWLTHLTTKMQQFCQLGMADENPQSISISPLSICFNHDGRTLAVGSCDNTVQLWDSSGASNQIIGHPFTGHTSCVNSVCFNPDGSLLASGSDDQTIRLWGIKRYSNFSENPLMGHTGDVNSISFNNQGTLLVSGSDDQTIRLWDPQTGTQIGNPFTGHTAIVNSVCFNNSILVSGSYDNTIRLWDPRTGHQTCKPLTGHTRGVTSVCSSHDGTLLASGSDDQTIRLWDPQSGAQIDNPLMGHKSRVASVCFHPDDKSLASGSYDKTIRLWNANTGAQIGEPLTGHRKEVRSVRFSPGGTLLASASLDEGIQIYPIQIHNWFAQEIKPEQVALLKHAQQVKTLDFTAHPGISMIALPDILRQKMPVSLWQKIKKNWNSLSPAQKDLAISTPLLAALGIAQINGY